MVEVEKLQRLVWPGNETDVVPAHLLLAAESNGGVVIGAYDSSNPDVRHPGGIPEPFAEKPNLGMLVGFVFGFPGLITSPEGTRLKHHSHMLGVHPEYRDRGLGFTLKRAQWQMVRRQGIDLITWTYDPLQSRNANLNISVLGAVCDTYIREAYGEMRDGLNQGLPSDRFMVSWWINTRRVERRLSKKARKKLDLAHFLAADVEILNPTSVGPDGLARPAAQDFTSRKLARVNSSLVLLEIPVDFQAIRSLEPSLALDWRLHIRECCESLFQKGYLVTDFIFLPGTTGRSFYVLSQGMSTL